MLGKAAYSIHTVQARHISIYLCLYLSKSILYSSCKYCIYIYVYRASDATSPSAQAKAYAVTDDMSKSADDAVAAIDALLTLF